MNNFLHNLPPVEGEPLGVVADPTPASPFFEAALVRDVSGRSVTVMPWLPQLPDAWATELYEQIEDGERSLVAPRLRQADYELGTASSPDEIVEIHGDQGAHLFAAEHATSPVLVLTGTYRMPDAGTAGLTAVLAKQHGIGLILNGRQTTNVPSVEDHPFKDRMKRYLPGADSFISVHGMALGKFVRLSDPSEIHASIGLGENPTEAMQEFGHTLARRCRQDLGLYVVVGNNQEYYVQKNLQLKRDEAGEPYHHRLAALKPTMTTNVARREFDRLGRSAPALQIELTNLLRLTPEDGPKKDQKSRIIGTALGYLLLEQAVKLAETEPPEQM